MFLLDRKAFRGVDSSAVAAFVTCWERYYRDNVSISPANAQPIDYIAELNLAGNLTPANVTRLLRWKDPRMLTHPKITSTGTAPNPRVVRVLKHLRQLNQFRRGEMDVGSFTGVAAKVFSSGIVWQLFLFHIARPWDWPIADQHVFRAHAALFGDQVPTTIADFEQYRSRFAELAGLLEHTADDSEHRATVLSNKRLDSALMSYGQFLLKYDR